MRTLSLAIAVIAITVSPASASMCGVCSPGPGGPGGQSCMTVDVPWACYIDWYGSCNMLEAPWCPPGEEQSTGINPKRPVDIEVENSFSDEGVTERVFLKLRDGTKELKSQRFMAYGGRWSPNLLKAKSIHR